MENKQCNKGLEWCPIQKKCVPKSDKKHQGQGLGKGKGHGPIGQPMNKIKEATELVDTILIGNYTSYKMGKNVDTIIDEIENQIDTVPDQDIDELYNDVKNELSTDSNNREEVNDEKEEEEVDQTTAVKSVEENMKNAVQLLVTEETYREYFKGMLKKYNINSPSDLDDSKKKEFFDDVDKGWKAKNESDESKKNLTKT